MDHESIPLKTIRLAQSHHKERAPSMVKVFVRRSFVSAVLMLLVIGFAVRTYADHSWGGYHWARTSNPFTLKVGDNVSSAWDAHLNMAISDWHGSSVLNLVKMAGGTKPKVCRPTSGQIEVCNASYGNTGWLGIAQIWITGGVHITQAITKVNDTYFSRSPYNTPAWRQLVMCQEVGHDFGLDHQDEDFTNSNLGTCMDYTDDPEINQHPNVHDFQELEAIYSHVDSTTTVGSTTLPSNMPPAMGQIEFDTPAQWGKLIRSSANGRVQVYDLDFGRGHRVVTHVFWADPRGDAR
jgi:hypothetical protein